jgi:pilus assembly protein CpaB
MNRRSVIILLVAMVCGLMAMYGANQMISANKRAPEIIKVLIAARDLKEEEIIKPDMVRVEDRPKNEVRGDIYTNPSEVEGRWLSKDVDQGEPIRPSKLGPKNSPPSLVTRIPKGMRAVAIEVNEQTGVSGFVFPGHHVDVLVQPNTGNRTNDTAETILEDVLVLAAGQATTRPEDKSIQVRSVTLAVAPEDAERLAGARIKGPVSLSLRGLDDTTKTFNKKLRPAADLVKVVVAKHSLEMGRQLAKTDLEVIDLPRNSLPEDFVSEPDGITGEKLAVPVNAREMILKSKLGEPPAPPQPAISTAAVVVATRPLRVGDRILPACVSIRQIESAQVTDQYCLKLEDVIGLWVAQPLEPNAPVLHGSVTTQPPLAERIEPWTRAVAIEVGPESTMHGQLLPGDRVDVYDVGPAQNSSTSTPGTPNPLQSMLAALPNMAQSGEQGSSAQDQAEGEHGLLLQNALVAAVHPLKDQNRFSITLMVPVNDVTRLVHTAAKSELKLSLRARQDAGLIVSNGPTHGTIYHGFRARPQRFLIGMPTRRYDPGQTRSITPAVTLLEQP